MKAQSAVEYLMTYGWSILIIAVVIASLIELGVFNSVNASPSACIATTGYSCTNPTLYASGALVAKFGQVSTGQITITGTACTRNSTVTTITPVPNTTIQSDQQQQIIFHCPITSTATGTQFTGHLWIEYSTETQQNIIQEVGSVITPVVSSNAAAYAPTAYIVNYVGGSGIGNMIAINLNTGQMTGYPSDGSSNEFVNPRAIIVLNSTAYIINRGGGSVYGGMGNMIAINLNNGQTTGYPSDDTSNGFHYPIALSISGSTAYILNHYGGSGTGNMIAINLNNGQTTGYPSDGSSGGFRYPDAIAVSGSTAYIINHGGGFGGTATLGNMIAINLNNGLTTGYPSDGSSSGFNHPKALAVSGSTAYIINYNGGSGAGNMIAVNLNNGQTTGYPSDGSSSGFYYPSAITISNSTAYILNTEGGPGVNGGTGNMIAINLNTGAMAGYPSDGSSNGFNDPQSIAISTPSTP